MQTARFLGQCRLLPAMAALLPAAAQGQRLQDTFALPDVTIAAPLPRRSMVEIVDASLIGSAGAAANFENILKVLPGVQSGNELSSQYSVRGGSYDENLVFVEGVEIFRPMLARTGQQEGLSFINPQMVSAAEFSIGAFPAEFGDRMSSVLNVRYKRPTAIGGSLEGGLLGGAATGSFINGSRNFSGIVGLRTRRSAYLLETLNEKGEYTPVFYDAQALFHYDIKPEWSVHFFGNYALNLYDFVPADRQTSFAGGLNAVNYMSYNEGGQHSRFSNALAMATADYRPAGGAVLSFTASAAVMDEQERLDILSEYFLTWASKTQDPSDFDVGGLRQHARNSLATTIWQASHKGVWANGLGALQWGAQAQFYSISDNIYQWQTLDSAGYMYPRRDGGLQMRQFIAERHSVYGGRYSGYVQQSFEMPLGSSWGFRVNAGVRALYSALNGEFLAMPRVQAAFYPLGGRQLQLYAAAGLYGQPAFYKETKDDTAGLHLGLPAQRSLHFVAGSSIIFRLNDIPCKFTAEAYYKHIFRLVPYAQDNIGIVYHPQERARGYIYGLDVKLNAEMLEGTESWLSVSLMQARQDIAGDALGWLPMPADQRINVSAMMQDQMPYYPRLRAHLMFHYGSPLPVYVPAGSGLEQYFRMPAYLRADMGLTFVILDKTLTPASHWAFHYVHKFLITIEIMNLFNIQNISSYQWIPAISGSALTTVAVPNYLTPRLLNIRVALDI